MKLFENTNIPLLAKALGAYSLRHKVIASNVANINTVGYRRQQVSFEEQLTGMLQQSEPQLARTDTRHLSGLASPVEIGSPRMNEAVGETGEGDPYASGVNDVDIDAEMAELAQNQIRFKFAARLLSNAFQGIQKSIRGQL